MDQDRHMVIVTLESLVPALSLSLPPGCTHGGIEGRRGLTLQIDISFIVCLLVRIELTCSVIKLKPK